MTLTLLEKEFLKEKMICNLYSEIGLRVSAHDIYDQRSLYSKDCSNSEVGALTPYFHHQG